MYYDIIIIGGGVIGCAIAREASKYCFKTALFERELDVAEGISKANSGVLHAGFNVKQGTLKAIFNIEGLKYFPELAIELGVEYKICGKLVVAKDDSEKEYLEKLLQQGYKNRCSGLSIINQQQIEKLQPGINGKWALLSESTGLISPFQFTIALAESAVENGVEIFLHSEVISITKNKKNNFVIETADGKVAETRWLINSAGIKSDKIKSLIESHNDKIYPCRGEYYILDKTSEEVLNMPIYPVPPKDGSGLGVHLTPTCNGNILIGPSADYIMNNEDTANTDNVMNILKEEAYQLLPELKNYSFIKNYSGIRPKLFKQGEGVTFRDFIIEESKIYHQMINLIGIESPGLTSAPAIAAYVVKNLIGDKESLNINSDFIKTHKNIIRTSRLSDEELENLINVDKNYAEVICRCENISKAEIIQAINNPLKAKTLNAIKKRTYSMMGRCQGGFCMPKIAALIMEITGAKPENILKSSEGSGVFIGKIR